ncbi:MAG: HEPN domain-containing protein [Acidiferrobacter sp.]
MAIEAVDWLSHAKQLLSLSSEPAYRDVISRSYYATYHRCLPLADGLHAATEGGVHKQLSSQLTSSFNMKLQSLGYMLKQIRSARVNADYFLDLDIGVKEAQEAIALAERIFDRANEVSIANKETRS